jgi:hypothetical protein
MLVGHVARIRAPAESGHNQSFSKPFGYRVTAEAPTIPESDLHKHLLGQAQTGRTNSSELDPDEGTTRISPLFDSAGFS